MDDRHPKRRKDKYNPYTLSLVDGKCYLSFKDGQGFPHKLELDVKLYALFMNPYRHRHFEKESGGCRKIQKRRLQMYFFDGLTYEEIAERERCSYQAVQKSVSAALKKIREFLK